VIFKLIDNTPIKCKITKFVRIPTFCRAEYHGNNSLTIKSNEILDLFVLKNNEYETIFYVLNDTIRFISRKYEEYRKVSIAPLFDYKSGTYNFIGIDKEKYKLTKYGIEPAQFVKAPNGDLYFIVDHTSLKVDKNSYKILAINNLTKRKVLFNFTAEEYYSISRQDENIFPTILYTYPILNSFIVVMRIDDNKKLEKTSIYLVNLVEGVVEEIEYDLREYMIELMYNVGDYIFDLLVEVSRYYELKEDDRAYFTPEKILETSKIEVYVDNHCKLIKYQDNVPTYSECNFYIAISLKNRILYTDCTFDMNFNIVLSVYFEKSELKILMATDEGGYIKVCGRSGFKYDIPSNEVLLNKSYHLNSKYEINKSQLYSIISLSDKYLINDIDVYELVDGYYKQLYTMHSNNTTRFNGISITYRSEDVLALILPNLVKENPIFTGNCTLSIEPTYSNNMYFLYDKNTENIINFIDWSIIKKLVETYKEQEKENVIIEFSEYLRKINISNLLEHIERKLHKDNIEYDRMYYIYYFVEETCSLYILISLFYYQNNSIYLRFAIVKYDVLKPVSHSEILFLSDTYELDIYPEVKLKNHHRLLQEIMYKTLKIRRQKMYFDDLIDFLLISYLADISKHVRAEDKKVQINSSTGYLFEISKRNYGGLFLYDKELIIKDSKIFMDIKDIKYNRQSVLKNVFITYPKNGGTYSVINRYGNILIYQLNIRDVVKQSNYDKFRLLIMVSECEISQVINAVQK
jgi:hypothetical protein